MAMQHAKLSASSSGRWLNCPASVKACEGYADKSSHAADWGTCAHELAQICLEGDKLPADYLGQTLSDAPNVEVDQEMITCVEGYIEYCSSFEGEIMVEQRVDFSEWVPEGFGTADFICITDDGVCHVVDLKTGKGVEVSAIDNSQAMLYALGVLNDYGYIYDIDRIVMHIYQPRIGNISECEISVSDLLNFGEYAKKQAELALSVNAPFNAGEKQCQFCLHKGRCVALRKHTEKVIGSEFDNLDNHSPNALSDDDLGYVLENKKLIESWLKAVEQVAFEVATDKGLKGYKLVEGRSLRKWADETEAAAELSELVGEKAYERNLLSPAKAEKLLGRKKLDIAHLIIKPEGKPTLVPESDPRSALGEVSADFDDLT